MRKWLMLAATAIVCATANSAASASELIVNGGFDSGLTGYTVAPGDDIKVAQGYKYIYDVSGGDTGSIAQYANYFATFGEHNVDNISTLTTNSFNTVAGKLYKLSFDYGQFDTKSGTQILNFAVGSLAGTIANPNTSINLSTLFQSYTYDFIGDGSPTQVSFSIAPSATFRTDGLLDNVSVSAVPELSTWGMMFLGLGGAGAIARRRRARVAFA